MRTRVFLGVALLASAGCSKSSTGGTGDGAVVTAAQACADLAQVECAKRMTCSSVNLALVYGTNALATCMTRETLNCMAGLAAPDTSNTPSLIEECVTEYATLSCADQHENNPPSACSAFGPRGNGMPCTFQGQCATNYCAGTKTALCGECADPPATGDSCASSNCYHDQECVPSTQLCQPYGATNVSCDADHPCADGLSCTDANAMTSTPGTCQPASAAGAACGGTLPGCDGFQGEFCGGATGAKTCGAISYVGDGMACGTIGTTLVQCTAGNCYTSTGLATGTEMGTCKANAADGAACDPVLGPDCLTPARCVPSGDAGASKCVMPTGSNDCSSS